MDGLQKTTRINSRCYLALTELSFPILLFQRGRSNRNYCGLSFLVFGFKDGSDVSVVCNLENTFKVFLKNSHTWFFFCEG